MFLDTSGLLCFHHRAFLEALTTDYHFEQAGFVRLLKP
jgi:hypothetical protein